MDRDHRDLVRRLFVQATEILEDNHIVATEGQSARLTDSGYATRAKKLNEAAQQLGSVASAILSIAKSNTAGRR